MTEYAVTQIKDFAVSDDGSEVTFTLVTKYASEMVIKMPASCLEALKPPADRAAGAAKAGNRGKTALYRPKKWLLGGETTKHKLVALVFDSRTDREAGFALSPKSGKGLELQAAPTELTPTKRGLTSVAAPRGSCCLLVCPPRPSRPRRPPMATPRRTRRTRRTALCNCVLVEMSRPAMGRDAATVTMKAATGAADRGPKPRPVQKDQMIRGGGEMFGGSRPDTARLRVSAPALPP